MGIFTDYVSRTNVNVNESDKPLPGKTLLGDANVNENVNGEIQNVNELPPVPPGLYYDETGQAYVIEWRLVKGVWGHRKTRHPAVVGLLQQMASGFVDWLATPTVNKTEAHFREEYHG